MPAITPPRTGTPFEDTAAPVNRHPEWIRPGSVGRVPNGTYFQAARVAHADARRALQADPGLLSAPVICSNAGGHLIFLLPPHASRDDWDVPGTRFLRDGVSVEIPPVGAVHGPDIHWLTRPEGHQALDPARLRGALTGTPFVPPRRAPARRTRRAKPRATP
ncbi:hypothetical protein ACFVYR_35915 [Streptomyces sp. NPDC058284]|uniref:hypothetical protein n=1 Tax=unclassified Streptomyces TaxID=2593676 RepID=UPI003662203A